MSEPRRIAVIASSRATYGYKRLLIRRLHEADDFELQLVVTGMHLMPEYGLSVREIEADGVPIAARVHANLSGDAPAAWAKSVGVEIGGIAQALDMLGPDLVVVTGDRAEMFAAAVTAAYMNLPIAHIQAGDVSGHIDGNVRHAITKLAHLHLASCADSAARVERLGEEAWRIHDVGAPQLDELLHGENTPARELARRFGLDPKEPLLLVLQHAVLVEHDRAAEQMRATLEAIRELALPTLLIYPNLDTGGDRIIDLIGEAEALPFVRVERNLERRDFIGLLRHASVLLGNSSCGILEAPSFRLPAINIGDRQRGRMQADNVINCAHDSAAIVAATRRALSDPGFRDRLESCENPYGDGHSTDRIVKILRETPLGAQLLDKRITY